MNIWKQGVCLLLTLVMAAAPGYGTRQEPQTLQHARLPGTGPGYSLRTRSASW